MNSRQGEPRTVVRLSRVTAQARSLSTSAQRRGTRPRGRRKAGQFVLESRSVLIGNVNKFRISRLVYSPRRGLPETHASLITSTKTAVAPSAMLFERSNLRLRAAPPGIGNEITPIAVATLVASTSDVVKISLTTKEPILAFSASSRPRPDRHRLAFHPTCILYQRGNKTSSTQLRGVIKFCFCDRYCRAVWYESVSMAVNADEKIACLYLI